MSQCNLIHTLRSGKQVDNQVSTPSSSKQAFSSPDPTPSQLDANSTKKDKSAEDMRKPIHPTQIGLKISNVHKWIRYARFLIKSRSMYLFLMQSNKSLAMLNSLRLCAPRRERLMCPRRFF